MVEKKNIRFSVTPTNHITIECKINSISCKMIVDTGASNSCINYLSAKKFNMIFKKSNDNASSATNKIDKIFFSKKNTLEIAGLKKYNIEILLFDMTYINNSLQEKKIDKVDGIIGGDILNEFKAVINYDKKNIRLKF